ncbi:hypothetical protein HanIR_Chr08g0356421 [Helianthus annuus]|nr:hypothetical protein HanIR_Chr08g0356421 [Helianthus annuus]
MGSTLHSYICSSPTQTLSSPKLLSSLFFLQEQVFGSISPLKSSFFFGISFLKTNQASVL